MTISSSSMRMDYIGNGSTNVYSYTFRILDEDHLEVSIRDTDNVTTTLAINTDYTVSGVGSSSGGNVTLVDNGQAWLNGSSYLEQDYILTIRRVVPLTQTTDIRNQGEFYPEIHEDQFDRLVMIDQQQQDELDRAYKLPETYDPADYNLSFPTPTPTSFIGYDATGEALRTYVFGSGTGILHVALSGISTSLIVNADVDAAAAIAGSKINPDFGSQNIVTTGTLAAGATTITGAISASSTVTGSALIPSSSSLPNTGIYLPAAGFVGIATGGRDTASFSSDGSNNRWLQFNIPATGTATVYNQQADGSLCVSGGGSSGNGGNLFLYGGSHASKANDWELRSATTIRLGWDASANLISAFVPFTVNGDGSDAGFQVSSGNAVTIGASGGSQTHGVNGLLSLTSQLLAASGTSSLPGIAFSAESDSGIYRVAADRMGIVSSALIVAEIRNDTASQTTWYLGNGGTGTALASTASTQCAARADLLASSSATSNVIGFRARWQTVDASFTTNNAYGLLIDPPVKGASNTVTRAHGININIPTAGTNNAGLTDNTSFTGSWNLHFTNAAPSRIDNQVYLCYGSSTTSTNKAVAIGITNVSLPLTGTNQRALYLEPLFTTASTASIGGMTIDAFSPAMTTATYRGISLSFTQNAAGTTTRAVQLYSAGFTATGTISNRAILSDNLSFSGDFGIHLSGTDPNVFGGSITGASFIPSSSTVPTNGIFLPLGNNVGIAANSTAVAYFLSSSGPNISLRNGAAESGWLYCNGSDGLLTLMGSPSSSTASIIRLYGPTHASLANDIVFFAQNNNRLEWDHSATRWNTDEVWRHTNYVEVANQADPGAVTDGVRIGSVDISAGNASLSLRTEAAVVTESVTSDRTLQVQINGTTYKICLKS